LLDPEGKGRVLKEEKRKRGKKEKRVREVGQVSQYYLLYRFFYIFQIKHFHQYLAVYTFCRLRVEDYVLRVLFSSLYPLYPEGKALEEAKI
jgi:hypothetical protein